MSRRRANYDRSTRRPPPPPEPTPEQVTAAFNDLIQIVAMLGLTVADLGHRITELERRQALGRSPWMHPLRSGR